MVAPLLAASGTSAAAMGALTPAEGTRAPFALLLGVLPPAARGWYFGSDGLRSPLDAYRAPGSPAYAP